MKEKIRLYRAYNKRLKKNSKVAVVLFVVSLVILLAVNVVETTIEAYLEAMCNNRDMRTIVADVYNSGEKDWYADLKAEYEDNPDILSVDVVGTVLLDDITVADSSVEWGHFLRTICGPVVEESKQLESKEKLAEDEVIIPRYIPVNAEDSLGYDQTSHYINGNKLIGKKMEVTYQGETVSFTIKGTYNNATLQEDGHDYYVSEAAIEKFSSARLGDKSESTCYVVVKDYDKKDAYVDSITEFKNQNGYEGLVYASYELETDSVEFVEFASKMVTVLGMLTMCWACFGIGLSQYKALERRKQEFGLLKAMGYSNQRLGSMLRVESVMLSVKVLCISGGIIGILAIGCTLYWVIFTNPMWYSLIPSIDGWFLLGTVAVTVLLPLLVSEITVRRLKKIVPIEVLH
jgi:hypothetical protein